MLIGPLLSILGEPSWGLENRGKRDDECANEYDVASEASRIENEGIIGRQISRLSHHVMIGLNDGYYPTLRAANRVD